MNNNNQSNANRLGGVFLTIGWVIGIALVSLLIHLAFYAPKPPSITEIHDGLKITIERSHDAHFRIPGRINGIEVVFLVDTGATTIAVSEGVARAAQLPVLNTVITQTAGGQSTGYFTSIENIEIGDAQFEDFSAIIIPDMVGVDVLLGMNFLKNFSIKQEQQHMTLTIHNKT